MKTIGIRILKDKKPYGEVFLFPKGRFSIIKSIAIIILLLAALWHPQEKFNSAKEFLSTTIRED